jgi:hypothetical protein
MKFRTLILLAVLLAPAPLMACEGFENDMDALERSVGIRPASATPEARFAREFATEAELKTWTENSTLGGGRIEKASFEGRNFIFAYRSYTSGVKSSDAAVYMQGPEGWKLVKAYPVLMNDWIVAETQTDGSILFHPESENRSLMVLSHADIGRL